MAITLGKYGILIKPFHQKKVLSKEAIENIERDLDELYYLLEGDFEWVLTGGLAIPATIGNFYRIPSDIDIEVHEDELPTLVETVKEKGYGLFSRIMMAKIAPHRKVDVHKAVSPEDAIKNRYKHLRLMKLNNKKKVNGGVGLLDFLDVYTYHYSGDDVISNSARKRFPASHHLGGTYTSLSGKQIRLNDLRYIGQFRQERMDEIIHYCPELVS